jgi:hypothetical protein
MPLIRGNGQTKAAMFVHAMSENVVNNLYRTKH